MHSLIALLLFQLIFSAQGFYRLGNVNSGSTRGIVYLIDSNSIFLFEFSASEALTLKGVGGPTAVSATTSGSLSTNSMFIDASGDLLSSSAIEIRTTAGDTLIISFPVPNNIYIPCFAEYLGRFMNNGPTAHDLDGHVFIDRSTRRLFIAALDLDGSAPAAYLWLDTNSVPSSNGRIAGGNGVYGKIKNVVDQDVNVTVPAGYTTSVFRSLSVWCERFSVSFGHVNIPTASADSFTCSSYGLQSLGESPPVNNVAANVYVLGPTTYAFQTFSYNGGVAGTTLWSGTSTLENGFTVLNQVNTAALSVYSGQNVVITLPAGIDVCNTMFISVYNAGASTSYGTVLTSAFSCSSCPSICRTSSLISTPGFQCRDLSTVNSVRMEYRYDEMNSIIAFNLMACNLEDDQYYAFGLSASDSGVAMSPNGDVVVCRTTSDSMPVCTDYDLTIRSQCSVVSDVGTGACPDTVFVGGVNNYVNTGMERVGAKTTFTTMRAVTTTDPHDKPFTPGTPQYIIWAKGATFLVSDTQRWVLRHASSERGNPSTPIAIDFSATSECSAVFTCPNLPTTPVIAWKVPPICVDSSNNIINAAIGNSGEKQGYKAITQRDGWGIAWYLNGLLIPEIYVLRGTNVTFFVNGGYQPVVASNYHPFYLTSSAQGGILNEIAMNRTITETVYDGLYFNGTAVSDLTIGKFCEWEEVNGLGGNEFSSFSAYRNSLALSCGTSLSPRGMFTWTTDENTPSQLYYQCATHQLLGWKINVVDDLTACFQLQSAAIQTLSYSLLLIMGVVLSLVYATI